MPNDPDYSTIESEFKGKQKTLQTNIDLIYPEIETRKRNIYAINKTITDIKNMDFKKGSTITLTFTRGNKTNVEEFTNKSNAISYLQNLLKQNQTFTFTSTDESGKQTTTKMDLSEIEDYINKLKSQKIELEQQYADVELFKKAGYEVDILDGGLEFKPSKASKVHSWVFGDKEPIALTSASFIESPLAIKTVGTAIWSWAIGDKKATETRHEELAKYSLGLYEGIKYDKFTYKVLTSPAMVMGVYIPSLTLGAGYALTGLSASASVGGTGMQLLNLGAKSGTIIMGGAGLGLTASSLTKTWQEKPEALPGQLAETAFTFGLAIGGYNIGKKTYLKYGKKYPSPPTETMVFQTEKGTKFVSYAKDKSSFSVGKIKPANIKNFITEFTMNKKGFKIFSTGQTKPSLEFIVEGVQYNKLASKGFLSKIPITVKQYFRGTVTSTEIPTNELPIKNSNIIGFVSKGRFYTSSYKRLLPIKEYLFKPSHISESVSLSRSVGGETSYPGKFGLTTIKMPDITYTLTKGKSGYSVFTDKSLTIKVTPKGKIMLDSFSGSGGQEYKAITEPLIMPGGLNITSSTIKYPIWSRGAIDLLRTSTQTVNIDFDYDIIHPHWKSKMPMPNSVLLKNIETEILSNKNKLMTNLNTQQSSYLKQIEVAKTLIRPRISILNTITENRTKQAKTIKTNQILSTQLAPKVATTAKQGLLTRTKMETLLKTELVSPTIPITQTPFLFIGIKGKNNKEPKKKKKYAISLKKKKPKTVLVKTILSDPFYVAHSRAKYGKATHPLPTKSIWKKGEKTGWRLPTMETMKIKNNYKIGKSTLRR